MEPRHTGFAVAPSGAALAVWLSSTATAHIHAVVRGNATDAWSRPVTVSQPGSTEFSPEAAADAINPQQNQIDIR